MKKLFVVLLTVVLVLSLASMTFAAKTTWSGGGGDLFIMALSSNSSSHAMSLGSYMCLDAIGIQVTGDNDTYAKAWVNVDTWRTNSGWVGASAWGGSPSTTGPAGHPAMYYAIGINKVGGTGLSLAFNTKDDGYGMGINIGQAALTDSFSDFHTDTHLNTNTWNDCLYADFTSGNFTVKAQAVETPGAEGVWGADFIYNLDGGQKVYLGYVSNTVSGVTDATMIDVGASLKFGDIGLNVDYWMDKYQIMGWGNDGTDGPGGAPWFSTSGPGNTLQANVSMKLGDMPFDATLFYSMPDNTALNSTIGVGANVGITDKAKVSVAMFSNSGNIYGGQSSAYNVNLQYNVGAWSLVVGTMNPANTSMFYVGAHAGLW